MSFYLAVGQTVWFVLPNGTELSGDVVNPGFWAKSSYWVRVRVEGEDMDIPFDSIFAVI